MTALEELSSWIGFPWDEVKRHLDKNQSAYQVVLWEPDSRSQFETSLNSYYVMKFALENGKIVIYLAGKMIGRKSNL